MQIGVPTSEPDLSGKVFAVSLQGLKGTAAKPSKRSKSDSDSKHSDDHLRFASVHWQRRAFSEAWLTVLRLPLDLVCRQHPSCTLFVVLDVLLRVLRVPGHVPHGQPHHVL
jgi:hypothetical protein